VFWILAAVVGVFGLGWGQQFASDGFSIGLTVVVFVMALSFLGVWEVPIPGFATTRGAQKLSEQEGYGGAFFKGVLATLLATPCSAPGVTPALAWCVNKPLPLIYLVFTCMAVGMALPYIILGMRPELLRFLPRPGAWMETFKQLMGFVLMGTVVFLLTLVSPANILPTVAVLFGCWAACWWVGRIPYTAELATRLRSWAVAVTMVLAVSAYAFANHFQVGEMTFWGLRGMMAQRLAASAGIAVVAGERVGFELPWEPYSNERFVSLLQANKTVMIDFTADWCPTCKTLELYVLNTRPIREAVERLGIVTLKADYDRPEVKALADRLGRSAIPILAIFPRGQTDRPVLLPTAYTRSQLLAALENAQHSPAEVASR
jgi:thiol:disulfide interchange protein